MFWQGAGQYVLGGYVLPTLVNGAFTLPSMRRGSRGEPAATL